jgi:hypothetical protein
MILLGVMQRDIFTLIKQRTIIMAIYSHQKLSEGSNIYVITMIVVPDNKKFNN